MKNINGSKYSWNKAGDIRSEKIGKKIKIKKLSRLFSLKISTIIQEKINTIERNIFCKNKFWNISSETLSKITHPK